MKKILLSLLVMTQAHAGSCEGYLSYIEESKQAQISFEKGTERQENIQNINGNDNEVQNLRGAWYNFGEAQGFFFAAIRYMPKSKASIDYNANKMVIPALHKDLEKNCLNGIDFTSALSFSLAKYNSGEINERPYDSETNIFLDEPLD